MYFFVPTSSLRWTNSSPRYLQHAVHEQFGDTALRTKILKDGLLSKNENVQAALEDKLSENLIAEQEPGSSGAKVHARLLSSKILADTVHAIVDSLREVFNPSLAKGKTKVGDAEGESEEDNEEEEVDKDGDGDEEDVAVYSRAEKKAKPAHPDDGETGSGAEADNAGWESGTVDGAEVGEGAGWESGSIDEEAEVAMTNSSNTDDDSDDDGDNSSSADSDTPPAKKAKPSSKAGGASTFLPSLSVGYTRGDSDASDISDGEGAAGDVPRKNRRGQRARRAYVHFSFVTLSNSPPHFPYYGLGITEPLRSPLYRGISCAC